VDGATLRSALNLLLDQARLTCVVKDNVVQITTKTRASGKLVAKTYQVADLIWLSGPPTGYAPCAGGVPCAREADESVQNLLIKLITSTVAPQSWSDRGGSGTVDYFPLGMALVINQTPDVHEQIAELLSALRRLQVRQE